VVDILVLFPELPSSSYLFEQMERKYVRAVALGDFGSGFAGMMMITAPSMSSGSKTASDVCPDGELVNCLPGLVVPLPVVPSMHMPGDYNLFGLVTLAGGLPHSFHRHLLGSGDPVEGVKQASGLVLGVRDVHAVVEVVGDDLEAVSQRLFDLTAHDDVLELRTFVVSKENTRGFGEGRGTTKKKAVAGARRAAR
jgi:hypothetical protein